MPARGKLTSGCGEDPCGSGLTLEKNEVGRLAEIIREGHPLLAKPKPWRRLVTSHELMGRDPFESAANELQPFAGEKGVRVMPTLVFLTEPNNAQRSTPNVSMEAVRFEVLDVGR